MRAHAHSSGIWCRLRTRTGAKAPVVRLAVFRPISSNKADRPRTITLSPALGRWATLPPNCLWRQRAVRHADARNAQSWPQECTCALIENGLSPRKPRKPLFSRRWRVGGVVTQRIANPCTGVRFSYSPPPTYECLTELRRRRLTDRLSDAHYCQPYPPLCAISRYRYNASKPPSSRLVTGLTHSDTRANWLPSA